MDQRSRNQDRSFLVRLNYVIKPPSGHGQWLRLKNTTLTVSDLVCRAPIMKWGVVLSGAADFLRPADKLSLTQNLALMATGSIWTRWCLIIKPRNVL